MRNVTLTSILEHHTAQAYLKRSGLAHAIAAAYYAYKLAKKHNAPVDLAVKAAFLHDIGHYTWYRNGKWDYETYRENDIHAIKGAERAHRLLIELGEDRRAAKEIALAILLHTDSYLPDGELNTTPLQQVVKLADEADEEPGGHHHYRSINDQAAAERIQRLDELIEKELEMKQLRASS